ncbi:MAG: 2,3-bisphosphoglycerate-independent phosphoglycerate mutase [Anaerolineales bacterium]|jgi:2,3-bisphosphoglycerate-independent phosphoglycerate mutase|nr:2,3-bisphosphoglycerate-independent phosphoglycerate mutase [Anaerolineales bacterium]MDP7345818.1 2,3-bisphosphoglycerate-independent phosphoglycerate mutase [Anaerolineales bacterium]MDP7544578.1 2,3-bisphosphoglycerate-independent phosphoglycerate mutase [Anaerolineales bacterium]MDP7643961.1 2,3-bisphosphoglycerate-independent phosphoglycerate mutase [Anaerolineales bacterium]HJN42031.1 2,3-bisphosphoglycerate-independent phosphoglycerate mutase [Anaerolineales bacterium]|tara:strand:- start:487 stop:1695 length:1209 start_codon:yes stop_codon:yes gene_type:complete
MADLELMHALSQPNDTKMVLLVLDGLGGLPMQPGGPTELEAARTPQLDRLAAEGVLGQIIPILRGITPGSGPAHLALFGYDPLVHQAGRGVLEANGVGLLVGAADVAARGNFCTLDATGRVSDRRAGRISSKIAVPLVERLSAVNVPSAEIEIRHVKEYRFAMVMRGAGLHADIADTDPQQTGVPLLAAVAHSDGAQHTAALFNQWIEAARPVLSDQAAANMFTLRGFSSDPQLPSFEQLYSLNAACIATYPMYLGVARLAGMQPLLSGDTPEKQFTTLRAARADYDFVFVHIKSTDSRGEDGDFDGKVAVIEALDRALPQLLECRPDVLVVTGDHSTPARMRAHSWHPVPLLLWAPETVRPDAAAAFGEDTCASGGLGTFAATDLLALMLAHAGRLCKYGP